MAQENFFSSGSTQVNDQDYQDFMAHMEDEPITQVNSKDITTATEEDVQNARQQETEAEKAIKKAAELLKKQQAEDENALAEHMEEDPEEEQETKPKEEKSKTPKETKETEQESEVELGDVESFASDLYKTGILSPDDDDYDEQGQLVYPKTEEELVERLNWEKQKGAENMVSDFFSQHGPEWEAALRAIAVDGVHPTEYLQQFSQVQSFKEMDLSDEDNQERIVKVALERQGLEPEDVRDEIKKLKTNMDLETTAQRYHKGLVKQEEQNLVKQQQEAQQRTASKKAAEAKYGSNLRETYSQAIKAADLDGIPMSKQIADKAIEFVEKPHFKLPNGQVISKLDALFMELKNPHNAKAAFQIAALINEFEPGKPVTFNLKGIEKKAVTKETNKVFGAIRSKAAKTNSVPNEDDDNSSIDAIKKHLI